MTRNRFSDVILTSMEDLIVHGFAKIAEGVDILSLDVQKKQVQDEVNKLRKKLTTKIERKI